MTPFDVAPQVQQQERQRDKEQAQGDRARGGAGAHGVHQAVAGFDTEAASILFEDLMDADRNLGRSRGSTPLNDTVGEFNIPPQEQQK